MATRKRQHKATAEDLDLSAPIELVALSVSERAARCRLLESDRVITLRASRLFTVVPGQILTVSPRKQWRFAGHPYLSGEIESTRLDVAALGLEPLRLEDMGVWEPSGHYWGEEHEPIEEWAESNDLKEAGEYGEALKKLMDLCWRDLRCLDAHSHLGNLVFDSRPMDAIRHYEVGLRIGELSLGDEFDGLLPWGHIDNRPFLRCMHGYGLCLWRLARFEESRRIFDRMLWLNPSDNQGVRFLIGRVRRWAEGSVSCGVRRAACGVRFAVCGLRLEA